MRLHLYCLWALDEWFCRGLVTRNVDTSVKYFHDNHFTLTPFWPALSRDFKPYKPNPGALLHICQQWSILPQEAVMIGDSAKDDVGDAKFTSNLESFVATCNVGPSLNCNQVRICPEYSITHHY